MIFCSKNDQRNKLEYENDQQIFNQNILDSIIDDNNEQFLDLLTKEFHNLSNPNNTFQMRNYKLPAILEDNPTYFSLCAFFGAEKCFTALLSLFPSGINSNEIKKRDDFNRSTVHFACFGGSLNILQQLHSAGFDLNAKDEEEYLPSHYAAMAGQLNCIQYLWSNNANIFSTSSLKTLITPVQVASYYGNLEIVKFFFEVVPLKEHNDIIKLLINGEMIKVLGPNRGEFILNKQQTPLHYACQTGNSSIVNYFISKPLLLELQINKPGKGGRSPLSYACSNGSLECVKALMNCPQLRLIKGNKRENTYLPLIEAAAEGHLDIVKFLINDRRIDINQENSLKISAFQAAVKNNHYNVIKFLYENGATKDLNINKIGNIFLDACDTKNLKIIHFLDEIMNIPYHDIFVDEKTRTKRKTPLLIANSRQINYGDIYMHQACHFENQEMINFLLEKECTFDLLDVNIIYNKKSKAFVDFLIEKGLPISFISNDPMNIEMITSLIESGNLLKIKNLISQGFVLNKEIIKKYKLIELSCFKGNLKIFKFLMSYQPELQEKDIISSMRNGMYKYIEYTIFGKSTKILSDLIEIFDILLSVHEIDFNLPIYEIGFDSDSFISFAAHKNDFNLLKLFEKYHANFKDCKLNFDHMVDAKNIASFNFLKDRGCKFQNMEKITHFGYSDDSTINFPLGRLVSHFCFFSYKDPSTIIFMMDFSSPEQILEAKSKGMNLIDIFMNCNLPDGIIKAYKLCHSIFYPLSKSKDEYLNWAKETHNLELIKLLF